VRRYAILDQDDRYAEFRKPPTSPCVLGTRLVVPFIAHEYYLYKPRNNIVERLAKKEESAS
jgi:hypothetical protein